MTPPVRSAIVAGGGLAGIAAALELRRQGLDVTLLERRASLGGRVSSFRDPVSGRVVDNGQHVLLGACTELKSLLTELGTAGQVQWLREFALWCPDGGGELVRLAPSRWLPARARFLPSLLRLSILTAAERLAVLRGMAHAAALSERELAELDAIPFSEWLARERQPPRAVSRLWAPVVVSALNETADRASARAALWVFRRGFLGGAADSELGIPRVPLGALVGDAAAALLTRRGVKLLLGAEVSEVLLRGSEARGVKTGAGELEADAVVLATPWDAWARLLPPFLLTNDPRLRAAAEAEPSPIVSVHYLFGEELRDRRPAVALVESAAQWIFHRHPLTGLDEDRGHLVAVVSAARDLTSKSREELARHLLGDVRRVYPALGAREPDRTLVVTEWRATYSARPGLEANRPGPRTGVPGLYLAGDLCDVGWPPTMEGAVRAGRAAAAAVGDDANLERGGAAAYPRAAHG